MIEVLGTMFPGARFIHILRNGRDVMNSRVNKPDNDWWVREPAAAFRDWEHHVDAVLAYETSHPDRCLTVRYEELVSNPEKAFDVIYRFVDVPNDRAPIDCLRARQINSSFHPDSMVPMEALPSSNCWSTWPLQYKRIFLEEGGVAMLRYGMVSEAEMQQMAEDACNPRDQSPPWTEELEEYRGIREMARVVERELPRDAVVLVVSKGDERMLELGDKRAWHFPRDEDGEYPGYHPAGSDEAVARLERLRAQGAEYLVIPQSGLWWLEHYGGFREHLDAQYPRVVDEPDRCVIYRLRLVQQSHGARSENPR
ncbi:MAG: sulfotransferase family protein [Chloroflexota bacterium]